MVGTGRGAEAGHPDPRRRGARDAPRRIDTVVFDKTGTLTARPAGASPTSCPPPAWTADASCCELAAAVETGSEHPLAAAIARARGRDERSYRAGGNGFEAAAGLRRPRAPSTVAHAVVGSRAASWRDHGIDVDAARRRRAPRRSAPRQTPRLRRASTAAAVGLLAIADPIRPQAAPSGRGPARRGYRRPGCVTGDVPASRWSRRPRSRHPADHVVAERPARRTSCECIKRAAGATAEGRDGRRRHQRRAGARPGRPWRRDRHAAPTSPIEASDVTLVGGDPRLVAHGASTCRAQTMRIIRQNLFWAFAYNVVLIPVAMGVLYPFTGLLLDPVLAAARDGISARSVSSPIRCACAASDPPLAPLRPPSGIPHQVQPPSPT